MNKEGVYNFNAEQIQRYSRQIILTQVGAAGQKKLLDSSVLIVGGGGLGCPSSLYLTAAGVGNIGIIDADHVELSNLHRQILHYQSDLERPKAQSAVEKLGALNPNSKFQTYNTRLTSDNFAQIADQYDLIVEGSDNLKTKFMVNDLCVRHNKILVIAGVLKFEGQIMTILPPKTACYRCIFENEPEPSTIPNCSEAGIIGSVAGVVGCLQATEAIKALINFPNLQTSRLLIFDALDMNLTKHKIKKRKGCTCSL